MSEANTDLFHSEQEYYGKLTDWVRRLTAAYGKARTETGGEEGRLLRRNGGLIVSREEFLALLRPEKEECFEAGAFLEELRQIREQGKRTIRGGELLILEYLFQMLELTEFEAYLVVVSMACELDHELAMAVGYLNEQTGSRVPTLNLCLRMYTGNPEKRRLLLQDCLLNWEKLGLIFDGIQEISRGTERAAADGFQETALKLDYRIVSYLENCEADDPALGDFVQKKPEGELQEPLIQRQLLTGLEALYDHGARSFYLCGEPGSGRKLQAGALCEKKGRMILYVDSRKLPVEEEPLKRTLRRIMREALLQGGAALCICDLEEDPVEERVSCERTEQLLGGLRTWKGLLFFTGTAEWNRRIRCSRIMRKVTIPETTTEERILLWKQFLRPELWPEELNLEYLADKYRLPPGHILDSVQEYEDRLLMEGSEPKEQYLLEACRSQLEHRLGKDAVRIPVHYRWEDLVLPKPQKKLLKDACDQVKLRHQVYHRWGFEEKLAYGRGVSMIFYGPPGTGKTMGAQVIAGELSMELYKVDMSGILSKYVGESEKKLGNIFEQARKSQSILFFDEADVLFGKRTDQKDSNDKYANAGTAYLLQKIEEYEGIIILATNFLQNFDNAFLRRFKFIIEFPFTDVPRRREIWEKVFPADMPKEELDYEYLAQEFQFSGSQIKNVAVAAAFLAAGEGVPVHMRHVLTGVKREMAKTGKTLLAGDFGGYYYLMEEV